MNYEALFLAAHTIPLDQCFLFSILETFKKAQNYVIESLASINLGRSWICALGVLVFSLKENSISVWMIGQAREERYIFKFSQISVDGAGKKPTVFSLMLNAFKYIIPLLRKPTREVSQCCLSSLRNWKTDEKSSLAKPLLHIIL